jgi:5-(carboxyamino)imidazole ribonucleotide mutase
MSKAVAIVMGSQSDWETLVQACEALDLFGIGWTAEVVSAHRTPERLFEFARGAHEIGYKTIIAGAGGAAHLPGMIAALTPLPVLGVPIKSRALNGLDSLLSIVQMPKGVAVGTLAIGTAGAFNAGLLAAQILAIQDKHLLQQIQQWKKKHADDVLAKSKLAESGDRH